MSPITVLLSESSRIGCQLLREGVEEHLRECEVLGCVTTVEETVRLARQYNPDLMLLSAHLEDGPCSGLLLLRELRAMELTTRIIVLLEHTDREMVISAFRGGAKGVFTYEQHISMLCKCMKCVSEGQIWADSTQLQFLLEAFASSASSGQPRMGGPATLTQREEQIAQLVIQGLSNRDISRELHLSEHTVKNYMFRIFDKLGVSSRVALAMYMVHRNSRAA